MGKFDKPKSLDEYVNKGGEVLADKIETKKEWVHFCLRVPQYLLDSIDKEKRIGISKTGWILEAIQDKLKTKIY